MRIQTQGPIECGSNAAETQKFFYQLYPAQEATPANDNLLIFDETLLSIKLLISDD
jgi:hypothetical protein